MSTWTACRPANRSPPPPLAFSLVYQADGLQENGNYTEAKYSNISTAKFSDSVFELKLAKDASISKLK